MGACIISLGRQFPVAVDSSQKKEPSTNQSSCEGASGAPVERTWVGDQRHPTASTSVVLARAALSLFHALSS